MKDWSTGQVDFKTPAGWSNLECKSAIYPDFSEPTCHCLGNSYLTAKQSKDILDKVCRKGTNTRFAVKSFKTVPFKDRCGVTSLSNITEENFCKCSENNDNGVGE